MNCYVCRAKVKNMAGLRKHFQESPECSDEVEARRLSDLEQEVGLEGMDDPYTPFHANNLREAMIRSPRPQSKYGTTGGAPRRMA